LGSALVRRLRDRGADVTAMCHRASSDAKTIQVDLTDADGIDRVVRTLAPEIIFHCASYGVHADQKDAARMHAVNVKGTEHLLAACASLRPRHIVMAGSWTEFGASPYGQSRRTATEYACAWAQAHHASLTVLRFAQLYGPGESAQRFFPTLLRSLESQEPATLGSPDIVRDFVFIEDAVDACVAAAAHPTHGAIIPIASGYDRTLREAVDAFKSIAPTLPEPRWTCATARPWDTSWTSMDPTDAAHVLGWTAKTSLEEGLRQCIAACTSSPIT
jgi:nucleoside-diphosphate-sugar epimerase